MKMRMASSSSGGKSWLAGRNSTAPTRNQAVRSIRRLRSRTSAAAEVKPHAEHWSAERSAPQSRQRVISFPTRRGVQQAGHDPRLPAWLEKPPLPSPARPADTRILKAEGDPEPAP